MAGYIKLYRGSRETDGIARSEHYSEWEAWIWLLENCAWKETSRWSKKGEEIKLEPGQIHVSLRSLGTAWGWSRSKVNRFLRRLERVGKAEQSAGQSGNILTIVNWGKYQGGEPEGGTATGSDAGQPRDTQEEGKEGKEDKNYAFAGKIVRLNFVDFRRWQNAFPDLDLRAMLTARDDWLSGQPESDRKRWFQSTSSWLARQQQEAGERKSASGGAGEIW